LPTQVLSVFAQLSHPSHSHPPPLRHLAVLLGPKLYEANWRDLTRAGYLANVQVTEVWCPLTPAFYREYLRAPASATRSALAVMNPVKCWAMDRLLRVHEARGDKIIVFSGA
jgi:DNA excision repair protein ERCC-3